MKPLWLVKIKVKNNMKKIFAVAMLFLIACVGMASAAYLPNATPETQGISTVTAVACTGVMFESEEYVNTVSNGYDPLTPPLDANEAISTNSFNQHVLSSGDTTYVKVFEADTRAQPANGNNVNVITAAANENGKMVFDESILVEGVGSATKGPEMLCPFDKQATYPPYCDRVVGSTNAVISDGEVATVIGSRNIGKDKNVPLSLDYGVAATGTGSVTIKFDVNAIEGRGDGTVGVDKVTPAKYTPSSFEYTPSSFDYIPSSLDYTPGELVYVPSEFTYTPSEYTQEYWTTSKCLPKLIPSSYTPEDVDYIPEDVDYTPEEVTYTPGGYKYNPGGYKYTPSSYTPAKVVSEKKTLPSAFVEYHEKTTAIGTFSVVKTMSYTSGNNR
jgi:hypothetical protein